MEKLVEFVHRLVREEEGQDMVEYALILGLISIIAVAAVTTTGTSIKGIWGKVNTAVSTAAAAVPGT
jgi:pilus assembly protein Flp/PilA